MQLRLTASLLVFLSLTLEFRSSQAQDDPSPIRRSLFRNQLKKKLALGSGTGSSKSNKNKSKSTKSKDGGSTSTIRKKPVKFESQTSKSKSNKSNKSKGKSQSSDTIVLMDKFAKAEMLEDKQSSFTRKKLSKFEKLEAVNNFQETKPANQKALALTLLQKAVALAQDKSSAPTGVSGATMSIEDEYAMELLSQAMTFAEEEETSAPTWLTPSPTWYTPSPTRDTPSPSRDTPYPTYYTPSPTDHPPTETFRLQESQSVQSFPVLSTYISYVTGATTEPTAYEYAELLSNTIGFFDLHLRDAYEDNPYAEFLTLEMSISKTLFNAKIPQKRFDVYVQFDALAFFSQDSSPQEPNVLFQEMAKSNFTKYITEHVRTIDNSDFKNVNEVYFTALMEF